MQLNMMMQFVLLFFKEKEDFFLQVRILKNLLPFLSGEEFSEFAESGQVIFERLERFSKPVIAAIHGAALGGGLELAMSCHIRLVSENAKLGLTRITIRINTWFCWNTATSALCWICKSCRNAVNK